MGGILGPALFLAIMLFMKAEGLNQRGVAVLASTVWVAVWWIFEVMPIAATSLLPIVLFPLTGALSISETTASYGQRFVFLYAGGFILAVAIEKWKLHKRIALHVIYLIGTNVRQIVLGFMIATAALSMWISNTATSVMMLPIGMAVIRQLTDNPQTLENENRRFGKVLMLAIAYSASIGGIATLIGTPPNLVFAGIVQELYGIEITFSQWIVIGLPISVLLLFTAYQYLTRYAFSLEESSFPEGRNEVRKQLKALGSMSFEERTVLIVFLFTALAWVFRSYLLNPILPGLDDTMIAVIAALSLFLIPAGKRSGRKLLTWNEAVKIPWGVLLLFGGGMALAEGFTSSGLAIWLGEQLTLFQGIQLFLFLLFIVVAVNFLTEVTSNLATTAMLLPILAPVAVVIDVHPFIILVGATLAASCAFMLPVATPPNAVVFGSGYLRIPDMIRTGLWLNLFSVLVLSLFVYFLLPLLWNFDMQEVPADFRILE